METTVTFGEDDIGLVKSNMTLVVKTMTGAVVDTTGWTMTESQRGTYRIDVPGATVDSSLYIYKTLDPTVFYDGLMSPDDSSDLLQDTLDRLLELKVDGTLSAATPPTNSDDLTLYQFNDYLFELTLDIRWSAYLDGSYLVYFTIAPSASSLVYLAESVCTILDQAQATIQVPLTVTQMNIPVGSYIWQIQLRKENANPLLAPDSIKVVAFGKNHIRPTLKKGLPAPVTP